MSSRKLLQKLNSIKTQNESKLWIFKMTLKITQRVLHIDYAQAYQCELQHEIMKALWTKGSVNLFTCAVYNNSQTKALVFGTSYKGQDKFFFWVIYWNPVQGTYPTQWNCPGRNNLVGWSHIRVQKPLCDTWFKSYLQFPTNLLADE